MMYHSQEYAPSYPNYAQSAPAPSYYPAAPAQQAPTPSYYPAAPAQQAPAPSYYPTAPAQQAPSYSDPYYGAPQAQAPSYANPYYAPAQAQAPSYTTPNPNAGYPATWEQPQPVNYYPQNGVQAMPTPLAQQPVEEKATKAKTAKPKAKKVFRPMVAAGQERMQLYDSHNRPVGTTQLLLDRRLAIKREMENRNRELWPSNAVVPHYVEPPRAKAAAKVKNLEAASATQTVKQQQLFQQQQAPMAAYPQQYYGQYPQQYPTYSAPTYTAPSTGYTSGYGEYMNVPAYSAPAPQMSYTAPTPTYAAPTYTAPQTAYPPQTYYPQAQAPMYGGYPTAATYTAPGY